MPGQKRARLKRGIPNMFTLGNAVCGFSAIICAILSSQTPVLLTVSAGLIFLAMVFDAFDGRVARTMGVTSDIGGQSRLALRRHQFSDWHRQWCCSSCCQEPSGRPCSGWPASSTSVARSAGWRDSTWRRQMLLKTRTSGSADCPRHGQRAVVCLGVFVNGLLPAGRSSLRHPGLHRGGFRADGLSHSLPAPQLLRSPIQKASKVVTSSRRGNRERLCIAKTIAWRVFAHT